MLSGLRSLSCPVLVEQRGDVIVRVHFGNRNMLSRERFGDRRVRSSTSSAGTGSDASERERDKYTVKINLVAEIDENGTIGFSSSLEFEVIVVVSVSCQMCASFPASDGEERNNAISWVCGQPLFR